MNRPLPILATLLGVAGLIPFLGCGLAAVGPEGDRAMLALTAYGAVVLGFLGGVHWGFALQDPQGAGEPGAGEKPRLLLGVVPPLIGWVALLLAIAVRAEIGLALLLVGMAGTIIVEVRARRAGLMPRAYLNLRYVLSGVGILVLTLVLAMRVIGARVTL